MEYLQELVIDERQRLVQETSPRILPIEIHPRSADKEINLVACLDLVQIVSKTKCMVFIEHFACPVKNCPIVIMMPCPPVPRIKEREPDRQVGRPDYALNVSKKSHFNNNFLLTNITNI